MRLRLEIRPEPSRTMAAAAPLLAIVATVVAGCGLFAVLGFDPLAALYTFFVEPVDSLQRGLRMAAEGDAVGVDRGRVGAGVSWQRLEHRRRGTADHGGGGGGRHVAGALRSPGFVGVSRGAGGVAYGAIPAFLRTRFHANEILTSLMLNYVAVLVLAWLVHGPWRSPEGYNFPETRMFTESALLPSLIAGTLFGFQIKVIGMTPAAGSYAGLHRNRVIWFTLLLAADVLIRYRVRILGLPVPEETR